jgi:hypothetical protein
MRQQPSQKDDQVSDYGTAPSESRPPVTDGTRRPGSPIVGESEGPPQPATWKPRFTRASLATDPADPSHKAGRTALIYLAVILGIIALAALFVLLTQN